MPQRRSDLEREAHYRDVIGHISHLLRKVGQDVPEDSPQAPGESLADARIRRLEPLQGYSRRWEKHLLNRLSPEQLAVAEVQITDDTANYALDIVCQAERLQLAGHDVPFIAQAIGLSIELTENLIPKSRSSR
jgi:hypothetical protein